MNVQNKLDPTQEQVMGFIEGDDGSPIHMVNLLKFRDKAQYEDGRETDMTGEQAYALYSVEIKKLIEKVGGQIIFEGKMEHCLLGEVEELWDMVAIVRYPGVKAMITMTSGADYDEIAVHRVAGLEGQLNIKTAAF